MPAPHLVASEDASTALATLRVHGPWRRSKKYQKMPRCDPCVICQGGDDEGLVLLCDGVCDRAFHAHCVGFKGKVEAD